MPVLRLVALLVATLALAACETRSGLDGPPSELADFRLGHVVVIADKAQKGPVSRDASAEEWQAAIDKAVKDRFGRIEGSKFYHLGIHVDGFALAPPGIPLVMNPKSALIISVTALADSDGGKKLNEKPAQLTAFETLSGGTVVGTGYTQTREQQIENLAFNAALQIEDWLKDNPQFFDPTAKPRERAAAQPAN